MLKPEPCYRGCAREAVPKSNISRAICSVCQGEIDSGKAVIRNGFLTDLPDEIRRYDREGNARVAVYLSKGRPCHKDTSDAPEITWEMFVKYLLHNEDFYGSWSLWVFRKPDGSGHGAGISMESYYSGKSDHVLVRIKDGRL